MLGIRDPWLTARLLAYRGRPSLLARGLAAWREWFWSAVAAWVQPDPWESDAGSGPHAPCFLPAARCDLCREPHPPAFSTADTVLCSDCLDRIR